MTVALVPASSTPLHSRHLKRIFIAAEILKAAKICAGDVMVLRAMVGIDALEQLSLEDKEVRLRALELRRTFLLTSSFGRHLRPRGSTSSLWELRGRRSLCLERVSAMRAPAASMS
jgi:hypothetical protein